MTEQAGRARRVLQRLIPGWLRRRDEDGQLPLLVQLGLILTGVALVFLAGFYLAGMLYTDFHYWWPWGAAKPPEVVNVAKASATATALLGGAVAIGLGIRRQRSTEATVDLTAKANLELVKFSV